MESTFERHNIVSVVEDITLSVVPYAEYKNLNIIFDTDIEEKYVYCDPDKIERIILNLISNALKFTQPNGTIYVTIKESSSEKILIKVKDTGIGIPKEMLSKVFERYKQLGSTNHQSQGSGIGLSLVKSIVTTHNGSIWVESEVGKGSEFFIELPCDDSINYTSPERTNSNSLTQDYVEKLKVEFSDIYSF
ncbi:Adaptive-response sensory-kinase SasA [bioreactor metagenome]|uniref:histidine kinase n=1 Tax=bioreactor metagenome TaxID=1076179 RepID=A0A645GST6_9ZZZZ